MLFCKHARFCLALVVSFALVSSQAQGDLVYTITGFANNIGDPALSQTQGRTLVLSC